MEQISTCGLAAIHRASAILENSQLVEAPKQFPFSPLTQLPEAKPEIIRPIKILLGSLYQADQSRFEKLKTPSQLTCPGTLKQTQYESLDLHK